MLNKIFILATLLFCLFDLNAQDESNTKFRIEPGFLMLTNSDNLGLFLNVESKIQFSEKIVGGLRFGVALNSHKFEINDSSQFNVNNQQDNAVISFMPTFDYYPSEDKYPPYIGIGIGYYLFNNTDVFQKGSLEILEGKVKNQLGVLLRGGLDINKTRLGLEYNLIPKADIKIPDGQVIGSVNNSYFGLSIGFTIGSSKS